jgi:hypothetical protein
MYAASKRGAIQQDEWGWDQEQGYAGGEEEYYNEDEYGNEYEEEYDDDDDHDIFSLARHNHVKELQDILDDAQRRYSVHDEDEHGNTVLIVGCQNGLKRVVRLALRNNADINATNKRGNTGLHFCFAYGYAATLGEYLIGKCADDTIRNTRGHTCYEVLGDASAVAGPVAGDEDYEDPEEYDYEDYEEMAGEEECEEMEQAQPTQLSMEEKLALLAQGVTDADAVAVRKWLPQIQMALVGMLPGTRQSKTDGTNANEVQVFWSRVLELAQKACESGDISLVNVFR